MKVRQRGLEKWAESPPWTSVGQKKFRSYFKCNDWLLKSCNQKNVMT